MKTLQFGIVGLGHFGQHYVRLLQEMPGVKLINTSGKQSETEAMFKNTQIDCVIISSPPSTHKQLIISALKSGKHVFVEKPMVLNIAESKAVEKELKKNKNLVFMVGFQYVYNDYVRYIKNHIKDIGTIKYVMGEHLYCGPLRRDVGSFVDAGIHDCAVFEYLFSPGKVVKVVGASRTTGKSAKDDFTSVTVTFKSGLVANFITSWYWPEKVRKITLVGDKGMVLYNDRVENKLNWIKNKYPSWTGKQSSLFIPNVIDQPSINLPVNAQEPLKNELEHFIDCVCNHRKPLTGIEFGAKITNMMEQINSRLVKL